MRFLQNYNTISHKSQIFGRKIIDFIKFCREITQNLTAERPFLLTFDIKSIEK